MIKIITEDIIKEVKKNNIKCLLLNDNYVILYKAMEVSDNELGEYLRNISQANKSGINIPKVVDYKLLDESVGSASKGIFIEEKAKGKVLNIRGIVLKNNQEYNLKSILNSYLEKVENYLEELEKRASAPQEAYDKFLSDYINLHKFGLKPDPNSLNYFFDSKVGYTIIDPYPNESNTVNEKELFRYIMNAIYGVARPNIIIKKENLEGFYYLTEPLKIRMDAARELLNKKISSSFFKAGFSEDYILEGLEKNRMRAYTEDESLDFEEILIKLKEQLTKTKNK